MRKQSQTTHPPDTKSASRRMKSAFNHPLDYFHSVTRSFTYCWFIAISLLVCHAHANDADSTAKPHTFFRTPDQQVQVPVRSFLAIRNANIVMQQKDYSCGAATL